LQELEGVIDRLDRPGLKEDHCSHLH
jgi:hypothetical protein